MQVRAEWMDGGIRSIVGGGRMRLFGQTEATPKPSPSAVAGREKTAQADKTSTEVEPAAAGTEELAGLKELSAEDRAAAEKQRICPVTGALLGSMGAPYKVKVKNQTVFLCCEGCKGLSSGPGQVFGKTGKGPRRKVE